MKTATILDQQYGTFALEYDNNLGKKNTMRLEALTYDRALREARQFLGIQADDYDQDGNHWDVE